jgi:two-component system NtrC family response regulator
MAPALQAKLLRVLQERVVTPVGGKPVPIDVRILSATHRDLAGEVSAGRFREDLYWRLGVVPLALPPLRERLADIVELAEHFLATVVTPPKRLSADAASQLLSHGWPGNVRELRNAMERAATLGRSAVVTGTDLGFLRPGRPPAVAEVPGTDLPGAVERLERAMIERALRDSGLVRAEAARRLGIHRQLLHEKMRRYGIETSANTTDSVRKPDGDDPVTGLKDN